MSEFYVGCVEDRLDPLKLGRCRVRIVGLHSENKQDLPTADLPWAYPQQPLTSAGVSGVGTTPLGPVPGTWVRVEFADPAQQVPVMVGTLGGSFQTPESLQTNQYQIDATPDSQTLGTGTASGTISNNPGSVVSDPNKIVGPLGTFISKNESDSAGYNAFNRGTVHGKIIPAGGRLELTKMSIKQVMALQALPPGNPQRLFAVGKYQCIPSTLKSAVSTLNIDPNQPFNQQNQDLICQNYLVGLKRPPLMAYYRGSDRNDEAKLTAAGRALSAEFASIEDPTHLGYPYGGQNGTYYRSGNRASTKWAQLKPVLQREWDFRNSSVSPTPAIAAANKVDQGTDYDGVNKAKPVDISTATLPVKPVKETSSSAPSTTPPIPIAPPTSLFDQIVSSLDSAVSSVDQSLGVSSTLEEIEKYLGSIGSQISGVLAPFGSDIKSISSTLGIDLPTGSTDELASKLGLGANYSSASLANALAERAGSRAGQAQLTLSKLGREPTKAEVAPVGERNPDGSTSLGTTAPNGTGFADPSGKYPAYYSEPDTNRLATGANLERTPLLTKTAAMVSGVKVANGGTWDEPAPPYNSEYPYNKVQAGERGNVFEMDDTPGAERIHLYHAAGTFTEIDANGTQVNHIVGDGYHIVERNGYIYVKGGLALTAEGTLNLRTNDALNVEVSGATNINVYNDANINVSKNCNLAVGAALTAKANTVTLESEAAMNLIAGTGLFIHSGSDTNILSKAAINVQSAYDTSIRSLGGLLASAANDASFKAGGTYLASGAQGVHLSSGDELNLQSVGKTNINSGSDLSLAGAHTSVKASGDVSIDSGGIVDLNNGSSADPESATPALDTPAAVPATLSALELPVETRGTSGIGMLAPMKAVDITSEIGFDTPDAGDYTEYMQSMVAANRMSPTELNQQRFEQDSSGSISGSAKTSDPIKGVDVINSMTPDQFTAGMRLSKYFTLGDLTKGGTRIPRVTYTVKGVQYTPQQIVINLKNLAVNVLDPIRDKFGEFVITSAFRRPPVGNQPGDLGTRQEGGDHPIGCAADIVLPASKQKTYEMCTQLPSVLKCWNQVIMEYTGDKYWVHVSAHLDGNQGACFTMFNNRTYAETFPNGGFKLLS